MVRLQKERKKEEEMKLGKCPMCGGKTRMKHVDLTESVNGKMVIINSVKAEVCSQCGERLFSEDEMKRIDSFLMKVQTGSVKPERKSEVEVYSLA
jgi:YgiT-type zinc finger domain-containing protein